MYRSDDLADLFAIPDPPDSGFHQGIVKTWNASTGANSVEVSGALLTNLPALTTGGGTPSYQPGQVVWLQRFHSTYLVLGRITGGA